MINENETLVAQAKGLGKHETKTVVDGTGKHILCGTCLAYEDEVWNDANKIILGISRLFGLDSENEPLITELSSELRDRALKLVLKANKVDLVIGSNEY